MTGVETTVTLLQSFAFVVLYLILGFGPGFVIGVLLSNALFARDKPTFKESYNEKMAEAAKHNEQWDPKNERWQS